jgi:hypothetical protein
MLSARLVVTHVFNPRVFSHMLRRSVMGANGDLDLLESIDGRSYNYSVDQSAVRGRLNNV